jgi:hypothetical protein
MKSSSLMVPTTLKNQRGSLEVPYMSSMSSMSHTNGTHIIGGNFASKSPSNDNVSGVGGQNRTHHLVNPLANLALESKS